MGGSTNPVRPVYAVVGKDRFLRHEAVERIWRSAADKAEGLGPARFEGDEASLAEVLDEVRTLSLLGGLRVVIVDDADDFITKYRASLETYCAAPAESGCLIFLCDSLPKNTRLYRVIAEKGEVIACEPLKGRALSSWLSTRTRALYGKALSEQAATMLREYVGESPGALDAEVNKLAAYIGARNEIAAGDVAAVTGKHREENVFAVTDALAEGNATRALLSWEQVLATDRSAPGRAIGGLAWALRRLLDARREWEAGADLRSLSGRLFVDPEVLKRRLERATVADLERQLSDLLEADLAIKTGASTIELAVEKFIVKHSIRPGAREWKQASRA